MGSTSSGTDTVTQKSEPWAQAQPYLTDIFQGAKNLYGKGQEYYPGSTVVPFHGDTQAGLQGLRNQFQQAPVGLDSAINATTKAASGANPYLNPLQSSANQQTTAGTGMINQSAGANPLVSQIQNAAGQQTTAGTGMLNQAAGANPYMSNIQNAAGQQNNAGSDVLQQFASGNTSPYLDSMFDRAAGKVRDNTSAMFSKAGRYGSTANQDALSDSLGDMASQFYGQAYETDANRRFGAAEALGARQAGDINRSMSGATTMAGLGEAAFGRQAGIGGTLAGLQANDLNRNLSGMSQAAGLNEAQYGRMAGAGGALAGIQQNDFGRQMSGMGSLASLYQQGNQQGLQAASLMPMLNEYAQSNNRGLMEIGNVREQQAGRELQDSMDRWNFGQNAPWELLSRYNQTVQPIAGLGGSSQQTSPGQSKVGGAMQGGVGGALAGSAFGPWGTAIGGGLGALGGLFG